MCGIIGYIGGGDSSPVILEGLSSLEYRGYDSAGIAVLSEGRINVIRVKGKVEDLRKKLRSEPVQGSPGIGHTRWATHGRPSEENAHPHKDCKGEIVVVHNGIIENYEELKAELLLEGHKFISETDTEVLAHLIEKYHADLPLEEAVCAALRRVRGAYAVGAISSREPGTLIAARYASPLIVGIEKNEKFIASDVPAIIKRTNNIVYLEDNEVAVLKKDKARFLNIFGEKTEKTPVKAGMSSADAEKGAYPHYMLKEIHEQPEAVKATIGGRISHKPPKVTLPELEEKIKISAFSRIVITACGTSWHAALIGKYIFEELLRVPVEVDYAAEFRYRSPVIDDRSLVIVISQSGETADTMAALRKAKSMGGTVISICNVPGSSIARASDAALYTKAGPEIGVASTKAFTTQVVLLYMTALYFAEKSRKINPGELSEKLQELLGLPGRVQEALSAEKNIKRIAEKFCRAPNFLYLGRGEGFPVALEGALKLKEVSYIHAEGYPAAEMKHGPIALVDRSMPVVVLALKGRRYEKIKGNIEEIKARGGRVITIASSGDEEIKNISEEVIYVPETSAHLSPIPAVIPLQLLSYYIAVERGCSVDQPRNLAKSVTVE